MTSPAGERDEPQQWQHETHPDYLERMRGASDLKREILALRSELRDVERQIAEAGQKP